MIQMKLMIQTKLLTPLYQKQIHLGWIYFQRQKFVLIAEGLYVEGLYVEGLYVEGLYVEGLYVEGLYVILGCVCGWRMIYRQIMRRVNFSIILCVAMVRKENFLDII